MTVLVFELAHLPESLVTEGWLAFVKINNSIGPCVASPALECLVCSFTSKLALLCSAHGFTQLLPLPDV